MEFEDFRTKTCKRHSKDRQILVTNSWGVYNVYKTIRKHGWYNIGRPLKEKEFYAIIRGINNLLAEEIAMGNTVKFPERMGILELRKYKHGVSFVDGKLKNTYPIDWSETMKLWYEDEEERKKKTVLRHESPYVFRVKYLTTGDSANYENKSFYQFALNRKIKKALKKNINDNKVDTLW